MSLNRFMFTRSPRRSINNINRNSTTRNFLTRRKDEAKYILIEDKSGRLSILATKGLHYSNYSAVYGRMRNYSALKPRYNCYNNELYNIFGRGLGLVLSGGIVVVSSAIIISLDEDSTKCWNKINNNIDEKKMKKKFCLRDFYSVESVLGEGAFGKVYKARLIHDGSEVALKVINQEDTKDSEFKRELDALNLLKDNGGHPHICGMIDHHDDGRLYYLSMELIEGGELFEHLIEKGPYSEAKAAKAFRQFSEALYFIHSLGMVHADLKPENLMLSSWEEEKAKLKVVDFGCSRLNHGTATNQQHEHKVNENNDNTCDDFHGTIAYWAPELFVKGSQPSEAADLWASGCILYILLTGSHPFDPLGCLGDDEVGENIVKSGDSVGGKQFLELNVFSEERIGCLEKSCVSLLKLMLHPDPKKRITSKDLRAHPWVQGLTASWKSIPNIDEKLEDFWQKKFRRLFLKKYGHAILGNSLSDKKVLSDHNLSQVFQSIDTDGNGVLDAQELTKALKELGVASDHIPLMMAAVDLTKDGVVSFKEFVTIMRKEFDDGPGVLLYDNQKRMCKLMVKHCVKQKKLKILGDDLTEKDLEQMFHYIDLDGNGLLDGYELRLFLREIGVNEDEISSMAASMDLDKSGSIDLNEFLSVMKTFA